MKDRVFKSSKVHRFRFNEHVASVFDDMLSRSIPFYKHKNSFIVKFLLNYLNDGDTLSDLGCSTANMLIKIARSTQCKLNLIGIDNSKAMLKVAKNKAKAYNISIRFLRRNLLKHELPKSDVFLLNYTLQFIDPKKREFLLSYIHKRLKRGGLLILSEKVISQDDILNRQINTLYHNFKLSRGYSRLEIERKKQSLDNILMPYSDSKNIKMLKSSNFRFVQIFCKWINFSTYIAKK